MADLASDDYARVLKAIEILGRDAAFDTFPRRLIDAIVAAVDVRSPPILTSTREP